MHKIRNSEIDRRPRHRPARPRARLRQPRSAPDRAGRGRHAERLHAAGRRAFALPDGAGDRAQHQPAGAGGARDRRHGGLDQDHVTPTRRCKSWSTYYELSSARAGRQAHRRRSPPAARATSCGPSSMCATATSTVEKKRFSAFIQGSSNLAEVLRERGIDTVLITGTVTGVCCESTARDAMMLQFQDHHGHRRQCRHDGRGPQRLAGRVSI